MNHTSCIAQSCDVPGRKIHHLILFFLINFHSKDMKLDIDFDVHTGTDHMLPPIEKKAKHSAPHAIAEVAALNFM